MKTLLDIVGITPYGGAGVGEARMEPEHMGSVDSPGVRRLLEDILESGKKAFERRRANMISEKVSRC